MWIYTSYLSRRQPVSRVQTPNHDQLMLLERNPDSLLAFFENFFEELKERVGN